MSDFDDYVIRPETLVWKKVGLVDVASTTRGVYRVYQKHHLTFTPPNGAAIKLGRFADPRKRAREHYNKEA